MARKNLFPKPVVNPAEEYLALPRRVQQGTNVSWRERWYADRGLPYEPPKLGDVGSFRCVGKFKLPRRVEREPGEDLAEDEERAA
jgi:hypothetical protein